MKHNLFISKLNEKDVNHFTTDVGLFLRRKSHKLFRKLCNFFTHTKVIYTEKCNYDTDEEYYGTLNDGYISVSDYPISHNKNNVIVERYPQLKKDESYIFVGNHTCPEDIEIMLNVIDRNSYLILGSVESLEYNPEVYLSWLNGMIVFDVLDKTERSELLQKMKRVLKTQSILIYPEGSHNYNPNKLINNLYDGPINLALETGKGIVPIIMLIDIFLPLDDVYDNFKSANTALKKEFKNLYIKYSVQLSMIKDSLIEIQKMLKHSNDVEKQEIYKKIKQEIKKNINPLIIQIVLDSNTIVLNYEKYVEDKNNAIHQLTKNELENKTLFNVSNYEMEINKLKKKYVKKK